MYSKLYLLCGFNLLSTLAKLDYLITYFWFLFATRRQVLQTTPKTMKNCLIITSRRIYIWSNLLAVINSTWL